MIHATSTTRPFFAVLGHGASGIVAQAVLSSFGCGAHDVNDAPPASSDGAIDADPWPCEPARREMPQKAVGELQVLFDVPLAVLESSDNVVETFFDGDGIVVVTSRQVQFVSLDGISVRVLDLQLPGVELTRVVDVAMGNDALGAIVEAITDEYTTYFCRIDSTDGLTPEQCTVVLPSALNLDSSLKFDGTAYVWHARYGGTVRRWRFDTDGDLVDEEDLWTDEPTTTSLVDVLIRDTTTLFLTGGTQCRSYVHSWTDSIHEISTFALGALVSDTGSRMHRSGDSSQATAYLQRWRCRLEPSCAPASSGASYIVTRFDAPSTTPTWTPVWLPDLEPATALIVDADRTVVVYTRGSYEIQMSRFSASGIADVSELHVPLSYEQSNIELQSLGGGLALDAGDYVFVYSGTGPSGRSRRLARLVVPVAE